MTGVIKSLLLKGTDPTVSKCKRAKSPTRKFCRRHLKIIKYNVYDVYYSEHALYSGHDILNSHCCSQVVPSVIASSFHRIFIVLVPRITSTFYTISVVLLVGNHERKRAYGRFRPHLSSCY